MATAVLLIGAIGGAAMLYANRDGGGKESASSSLAVYAKGSLAKLLTPAPTLAPDYVFKDAEGRDDEAFRETLRALSNRSKYSPVYANGIQVSDDKDTDRIGRLIDQAKESVKELDKLDAEDATDTDANKVWKTVFRHSFFEEETKEAANSASAPLEKKSSLGAAGLTSPFLASQAAASLSDSEKHSRMEAAVSARKESGSGGKPWSK